MAIHVTLSDKIRRVIETILTDDDLPVKLKSKLETFSSNKQNEEVQSIPFDTVQLCHHQLTKDGTSSLYLHELLDDSDVYFPPLPKRQRNPELVARLERLKREQEEKEYKRMTKGINTETLKKSTFAEFGAEVRSVKKQLMTVFNSFLTVICAFVFGYMAASYSHQPVALCILVGILLSTIVGIADLYFIAKTAL
ncbi:vacuolar ATPase assembly protein VMA12-like [Glandiceps talaboti]